MGLWKFAPKYRTEKNASTSTAWAMHTRRLQRPDKQTPCELHAFQMVGEAPMIKKIFC